MERNLYADIVNDLSENRRFMRNVCKFLCSFIILLIIGIVVVSIHCQNKMFKLINDIDTETSIEMNNDNSMNFGNITSN